jgi:pyruvate/2-oxoglutarate/acetoin dehydrogenase E1 component
MNAAIVHKVPLLTIVYDDGYGISVPVELQTTKGSISRAMEGFLIDEEGEGMHIYTVKGWDYPELVATLEKVTEKIRNVHRPALIHVQELTQPQGHSTSGSHERYKSKERLSWERENDGIEKMILWMLNRGIATIDEIEEMRQKAKLFVREAKNRAWKNFILPFIPIKKNLLELLQNFSEDPVIAKLHKELKNAINPFYSEIIQVARRTVLRFRIIDVPIPESLETIIADAQKTSNQKYHTHLYSETPLSILNVPVVNPEYSVASPLLNGYQILNRYFDQKFEANDKLLAFGEDVGKIGDVNQGFAGLQVKYGESRISDSGIREWSIVGQAIGLAIRGFRPIAEIQYLDYLVYAIAPLTDDLASIRYRTNGIQRAPAIIRTRGHRLEGIWHAGSPMGLMINSLRGMVLAVPRNMVQAAGMYNSILASDDPAIVVECLNGYRLKEKLPANIEKFTVPVGLPEVLRDGTDITMVTYGSCVREALKALELIDQFDVSVELIDVQTLLPFDLEKIILNSVKKTNKVIFLDEDLPGGATAYMKDIVLEKHGGFEYLDAAPMSITAHGHRPPFGSDGDYFSKPNPELIAEKILEMIEEYRGVRL